MSIYVAKKIIIGVFPPTNITCTSHTTTSFIFTFTAAKFASACEYTTDGGITHKPIQSGIAITSQSNGDPFVPGDWYNFRFRSYDEEYNDYSSLSSIYSFQAVSDTTPAIAALLSAPQEKGAIFKGYVIDDGNSVNGCEVWLILDGEASSQKTSAHTGDIMKFFSILVPGRHIYQFAIQNLAGTVYSEERGFIFERGFLQMEVLKDV